MSYFRTPEHRARQAELIRTWCPWQKSTGPRTAEGKAITSRNGFKGAYRPRLRALARELAEELREQREVLDALRSRGPR